MARRFFGTIVKRGDRYLGQYRYQGKIRYTPTRQTKRQVESDLTAIKAAIDAGTWEDGKIKREAQIENTSLHQWETIWLNYMEKEEYSPGTLRVYRSIWRAQILPFFGHGTPIASVDTDAIDRLTKHLQKVSSKTTTTNTLRVLRASLNIAKKLGEITTLPTFPPRVTNRKFKADATTWTSDDLKKIIDCADDYYRAAIALGSFGCMRSGEIAALDRSDIDLPRVRIDGSTKRAPGGATVLGATKSQAGNRTIMISEYTERLVRHHLDTYVPPGKGVLLYAGDREKNTPIDGRNFLRALRRACEKADLPTGRFHDLRHSGLTLYGQAGATVAELMARAGHSNPEIVMIYQHATAERDAALAERMM